MGKRSKKALILITDDDPDMLVLLEKRLTLAGYRVLVSAGGKEAIEKSRKERVDLIVLDVMMPEMDGFMVKSRLEENKLTAFVPVIFLTAKSGIEDKVAGFNKAVDDYITKPFHADELLARIKRVLDRKEFYENISMTDGLTGLYNVLYFENQFTLFFEMARRYKKIFSLGVIDVDEFKRINDVYSHAAGDAVLKKIAALLKETLRNVDVITRYGGDEFVVIFAESDMLQAKRAMERVRKKVEDNIFVFEDDTVNKEIKFRISVGIETYNDSFENETQLFEAADLAMYKDKQSKHGRK